MTIDELISRMRDSLQAKVVYAEPVEKDGMTIIPAAVVLGGGGGGRGQDKDAQQGEGAGFGLMARPAGAFIIENGEVRWQPALDATRLVGAGVIVLLALTRRFGRRRRQLAKAAARARRSS
ncbi:MAG TPA: spore germination protein GerW family protein [Actinophytocola sp.]|jgi:uncharacterized spore protein YtfJ|uniref:spore germination protein GerW family protein n=1 Tax=Actinophytocola sp. TaxID=1872138 RepID=UPI002F94B825